MSPAPDASQATGPITLVVEARDLDTDERSSEVLAVAPPSGVCEQRVQLAEAVARLHPAATMRSFAASAATFLDRQHLIVAFYADLPADPERRQSAGGRSQDPLFA